MKQRITENLVSLASEGKEENEAKINDYLQRNGYKARLVDRKTFIANQDNAKLQMMKGPECNRLILSFDEFLKEVDCKDPKIHLLWTLWNMIVFGIIEADSEKLKTLDLDCCQTLLDQFYRLWLMVSPSYIPDYVHILCCHLISEIKSHGAMVVLSNQGFENHHQYDKQIYEKGSRKGGKGSDYVSDILLFHYRNLALKKAILEDLCKEYREGKIEKRELGKRARIFGPLPRSQKEREKTFTYYVEKMLNPSIIPKAIVGDGLQLKNPSKPIQLKSFDFDETLSSALEPNIFKAIKSISGVQFVLTLFII